MSFEQINNSPQQTIDTLNKIANDLADLDLPIEELRKEALSLPYLAKNLLKGNLDKSVKHVQKYLSPSRKQSLDALKDVRYKVKSKKLFGPEYPYGVSQKRHREMVQQRLQDANANIISRDKYLKGLNRNPNTNPFLEG